MPLGKRIFILSLLVACPSLLLAQTLSIYNDAESLITGTWDENGTLIETTESNPQEGTMHLQFDYSYTANWAGFGLNLDNWGSSSPVDMSSYSHMTLAIRGLGGNDRATVNLQMPDGTNSADFNVTSAISDYDLFEIPMLNFTAGSSFDLTQVSQIQINATGPDASSSGVVYLDNIFLSNISSTSGASALTWSRFDAAFSAGVNLTNWLEAHWLGNDYPDRNLFTEQDIINFVDLGMTTIRMPVLFEYIASPNPPYDLDFNHISFSLVDSVITWAERHDATLIIDNHHGYPITNANFQTETARKRAIWKQLAERFRNLDHDRYFLEIYNEPTNEISNENWSSVAEEVVAEIRAIDQDVTLILGATSWNSRDALVGFTPLQDDNIIYTFHSYAPHAFTHQGFEWTDPPNMPARSYPIDTSEIEQVRQEITATKEWSDFYNVPVFLGEFGVSVHADDTSRCNWVETLGAAIAEHNMPWMYWGARQVQDGFGFLDTTAANQCFYDALFNPVGTSVENESSISTTVIYPNPVAGNLNVEFETSHLSKEVRIYDSIGKLMASYEGNQSRMIIPVEDFAPGLYIVVVNESGTQNSRPFVKR